MRKYPIITLIPSKATKQKNRQKKAQARSGEVPTFKVY
jgi:hypothetical protein